jgi:carbonic anhydrase
VLWRWGSKMEFMLGGAMITLGYHLQDRVQNFDFHHEHATPQQVWTEFLEQNRMSSFVRSAWPRTNHHPEVILVTCMDGRLDTNEIAGDTREYYYVLRLAGSVLSLKEEEMLELAVANGTKLVVFTTHSDCAAEKVAGDPARRPQFPNLSKAVDERQQRFEEFLTRDMIREKTSSGHLLVKWMDLDTRTERLEPHISSH